jgi:modulator of FtsH protease
MNNAFNNTVSLGSKESNKVLSNTYRLLSMTLAFAGVTALVSMNFNFVMNPWLFLLGYFALLFLVERNKNNTMGIVYTFGLTGLLGATLAPILNHALAINQGGAIASAFLGTGLIFLITSTIGRNSDKDYSKLGVVAGIGLLIAFVVGLLNMFIFQMGILSVIISGAFMLLSSFALVWQVNAIVRGGETNYVSATVTIFVSLYNIFSSLLHLILAFGGDD